MLLPHANENNVRQIVDAYRSTGGTARIDGPESFGTGLAIALNFLHGQANSSMNEDRTTPTAGSQQPRCPHC
ncbi:hypothetical protein [Kribbella sp. VKM Ac-2568]|uniref:hypothetical protein n=1 Tax=Kribbella sp. VKM Ac-2568 TaxID=2512219 RepID=UPI001042CA31|nr:hypothetical protein [Kribbella sp. VKM Ac-2568]TCM44516.1 hypothetical protein EV648_108388 [Kribbella sp. VKM Ac-2568]